MPRPSSPGPFSLREEGRRTAKKGIHRQEPIHRQDAMDAEDAKKKTTKA